MIAPEHAALAEQLNAYVDGELDAADRAAFERHLAACATCQLELEQMRSTRTAVHALSMLRAPRPMTITATAPAASHAGGWLAPWLPWTWRLGSLAAAACFLLAVLSVAQQAATPSGGSLTSSAAEKAAPASDGAF